MFHNGECNKSKNENSLDGKQFGDDFPDVIKGSNLTVADDVSYSFRKYLSAFIATEEEVNSLRIRLIVILLESKGGTDRYCTSAQLGKIIWESII